jgi:hypothetical protein
MVAKILMGVAKVFTLIMAVLSTGGRVGAACGASPRDTHPTYVASRPRVAVAAQARRGTLVAEAEEQGAERSKPRPRTGARRLVEHLNVSRLAAS